ncbi:hypothetical protein [Nostoc sp.]|uniref:hypothetical protein n=1 Tax=Nostoc sp. TaxID=1180 RepID=UPI002FFD5123
MTIAERKAFSSLSETLTRTRGFSFRDATRTPTAWLLYERLRQRLERVRNSEYSFAFSDRTRASRLLD